MIDWLDIVIPFLHAPLPAGRMISVLPDGTTEFDVPKRMAVRGSFDTSTLLRSQGGDGSGLATELYISGNPAKFLQGHNVFGTENICPLVAEWVRVAFKHLDMPSELVQATAMRGNFSVKRIDITRSFRFGSTSEVKAVLESLLCTSRSRMGRPQGSGGTVYHGKNSRRFTVKFYDKGSELKAGRKHALPDKLKSTPIFDFAQGLLRVELTLRSKELTQIAMKTGDDFYPAQIDRLFRDYFGRIEMATQVEIPSHEVTHMPRAIRSTYLLWKDGIDPSPMMSRATFYRHRSEILNYGVDVMIPYEPTTAHVIPLFRTVVGEPVQNPDWAYRDGLIFDPKEIRHAS